MGFMRKLALIALLAIACGATQVQAQTLKLAYSKGATYSYKAHMTLDESVNVGPTTVPVKFDMTATETQTVDSVDSKGVADLTVTLTNVQASTTVQGQTSTTTTTVPAQHLKVASDGRVLSVNGLSFSGGSPFSAAGGGGPGSAILHGPPAEAGATWTKDYDQTKPFGGRTIHLTSTSKYLRQQKPKGAPAAVIPHTGKTPA